MNTIQRIILFTALALFVATLLFIPVIYAGAFTFPDHRPFWNIGTYDHIQYGQLCMWWLSLVVIGKGLMILAK